MSSLVRAVPRAMVAGNWKMNGLADSFSEIEALEMKLANVRDGACDVVICPPATLLQGFAARASSKRIGFGGQDCHFNENGAHTGDISAQMFKDAGAGYVIVGHSERRTDHHETNDLVCRKAAAAHDAGLVAIICVGETIKQREAGDTVKVVTDQVEFSLPKNVTPDNTIIAYEPVWAIGTGLTPTEAQIEEVHTHIRQLLLQKLGDDGAMVRLLYGGSVKPGNAREILLIKNVNGALVGGASLKAEDFFGIISVYSV